MESVIHNVRDICKVDKQALERLLGHALREDQQVVIDVHEANIETPLPTTVSDSQHENGSRLLPEWCNVYSGLSDVEIADLEQTILSRADLSRPSE